MNNAASHLLTVRNLKTYFYTFEGVARAVDGVSLAIGRGETYALLMGQWLPRSGRQVPPQPCFEIYLNDPGSTDPEDLVTDVYVPLAG